MGEKVAAGENVEVRFTQTTRPPPAEGPKAVSSLVSRLASAAPESRRQAD